LGDAFRRGSPPLAVFGPLDQTALIPIARSIALPRISEQGPFAPPELPGFDATMSPSDSHARRHGVMNSAGRLSATVPWPTRTWVSQVPGCSVSARRPLTPRGAQSLHTLVASRPVLASPSLAGWPLPLLNGAETGSLALRLTDLPSEAATNGSLRPPLGQLPGTSNSPDKNVSSC
jgi:hypothetical protein